MTQKSIRRMLDKEVDNAQELADRGEAGAAAILLGAILAALPSMSVADRNRLKESVSSIGTALAVEEIVRERDAKAEALRGMLAAEEHDLDLVLHARVETALMQLLLDELKPGRGAPSLKDVDDRLRAIARDRANHTPFQKAAASMKRWGSRLGFELETLGLGWIRRGASAGP